jgi:hypothetical protein
MANFLPALNFEDFGGALVRLEPDCLVGSEIMRNVVSARGGIAIFAMDAFGDVYGACTAGVVRMNTETGDVAEEWPSMAAWETDVSHDRRAVGQPFLKLWEASNGKLPAGHRLTPKLPIVFGGEFTLDNIVAMSLDQIWNFRSDIVRQIRGLPHGARVLLDTK